VAHDDLAEQLSVAAFVAIAASLDQFRGQLIEQSGCGKSRSGCGDVHSWLCLYRACGVGHKALIPIAKPQTAQPGF
jgi:hypothetical protein